MSWENVVAIDGPCGSGKSSVAKKVAEKLSLLYIDTGAMYRAIAYGLDKNKINFEEGPDLQNYLTHMNLQYGGDEKSLIEIGGENITQQIRDHHISTLASKVSQLPTVRNYLVNFQRLLVTKNICVMEGRDIGTVVFPKSFCKIFLVADPAIRAQRRLDQLIRKGDNSLTFVQVLQDVHDRDEADKNRIHSPLKQAPDAKLLDTSDLEENEVVEEIAKIVKESGEHCGLTL